MPRTPEDLKFNNYSKQPSLNRLNRDGSLDGGNQFNTQLPAEQFNPNNPIFSHLAFMPKIIIISDETLESFYERTFQRIKAKYHTYPSSLTKSRSSANIAHHPTHYSNSNDIISQNHTPIGKLIG